MAFGYGSPYRVCGKLVLCAPHKHKLLPLSPVKQYKHFSKSITTLLVVEMRQEEERR